MTDATAIIYAITGLAGLALASLVDLHRLCAANTIVVDDHAQPITFFRKTGW